MKPLVTAHIIHTIRAISTGGTHHQITFCRLNHVVAFDSLAKRVQPEMDGWSLSEDSSD